LGHAHNVYINFLAETGVLGAGAFAIFWLAAIWHTLRASLFMPKRQHLHKALAIGILGTLIYLSIHNLFDNLFVQHLQLQLALLLGGLVAMKEARP
jgi:putative inorganic carbon (HCO3(-)) transporter